MEVKCGREFYSQQSRMIEWCKQNIGTGGWENSPALLHANRHEWIWTVRSIFGYTTFDFANDNDSNRFKDRWVLGRVGAATPGTTLQHQAEQSHQHCMQ